MSKTFQFNRNDYSYFGDIGERSVEIPIVLDFIKYRDHSDMIEVGFVLPQYIKSVHTVVDKFEKHDDYQLLYNEDIRDFTTDKKFSTCVCISTLEHVVYDECLPVTYDIINLALRSMRNMICDGGLFIVTIPFGYNLILDECIKDGRVVFGSMYYMKQVQASVWEQVDKSDALNTKYSYPFFAANGLLIAIDGEEHAGLL